MSIHFDRRNIVIYRVYEAVPACCLKVGEVIHMRTRDKSRFENFLIVEIQRRDGSGSDTPKIVLKLQAVGFRFDRKDGVFRLLNNGPVVTASLYETLVSRIMDPSTYVQVVGDTVEAEVPLT